jgi:hypothetical protein
LSTFEIATFFAAVVAAFRYWTDWYAPIFTVSRLSHGRQILPLALSPIVALGFLFLVLRTLASADVRSDSAYLAYYMILGAGWIGGCWKMFPLLGVSPRDDVIERRGSAAGWATNGGVFATMLAFAGGNIGNGPGVHVVLFSGALSTGALFLSWLLLEISSRPSLSDRITIGRDEAAGIRLAGLLISLGALFGAGVSGDWISAGDTVLTFAKFTWPAVILVSAAWFVEKMALQIHSATGISERVLIGVLPASAYVFSVIAYVGWQFK